MKFVQIDDNINSDIKAYTWTTEEGKIYVTLVGDGGSVQIDEADLAAIRKLFDQAKYVIGG